MKLPYPKTALPLSIAYKTLLYNKNSIIPIRFLTDEQIFDFCQNIFKCTLLSDNEYKEYAEHFKLPSLYFTIYPTIDDLIEHLSIIKSLINPNLIDTTLICSKDLNALSLLNRLTQLAPETVVH